MKKSEKEWFDFIGIIIAVILIEIFGNYCNSHKKEIRERNWNKFEAWHNEIMTTGGNINWDAKD